MSYIGPSTSTKPSAARAVHSDVLNIVKLDRMALLPGRASKPLTNQRSLQDAFRLQSIINEQRATIAEKERHLSELRECYQNDTEQCRADFLEATRTAREDFRETLKGVFAECKAAHQTALMTSQENTYILLRQQSDAFLEILGNQHAASSVHLEPFKQVTTAFQRQGLHQRSSAFIASNEVRNDESEQDIEFSRPTKRPRTNFSLDNRPDLFVNQLPGGDMNNGNSTSNVNHDDGNDINVGNDNSGYNTNSGNDNDSANDISNGNDDHFNGAIMQDDSEDSTNVLVPDVDQDLSNICALDKDGVVVTWAKLSESIRTEVATFLVNHPDWYNKLTRSRGKSCLDRKSMAMHLVKDEAVAYKQCTSQHSLCIKKINGQPILTPLCNLDRPYAATVNDLAYFLLPASVNRAPSFSVKPRIYNTVA